MGDVVNLKGQSVEPTEVMPHDQWVELVRAHMLNTEMAIDILGVRVLNLEKREEAYKARIEKLELKVFVSKKKSFWRWF